MESEYSPPTPDSPQEVFFRGAYIHRTLNGVAATAVPLVFGAIILGITVCCNPIDDRISRVVGVGFLIAAFFWGGIGLRALWGFVRDEQVNVAIDARGITRGDRFWAWSDVRSFAGTRYDNGVSLSFELRRSEFSLAYGNLSTTPLLTDDEYVELAEQLIARLRPRFPDVDIAPHPLAPDSIG